MTAAVVVVAVVAVAVARVRAWSKLPTSTPRMPPLATWVPKTQWPTPKVVSQVRVKTVVVAGAVIAIVVASAASVVRVTKLACPKRPPVCRWPCPLRMTSAPAPSAWHLPLVRSPPSPHKQ